MRANFRLFFFVGILAMILATLASHRVCWADRSEDEGFSIVVRQFKIVGNTALDDEWILELLEPYTRKPQSLAELKGAARKLTQAYRDRGYFVATAYVPPQVFDGKTVTIRVLEGKVRNVRIEGANHYPERFIRRYLGPALKEGVLRRDSLQKALLTLNQFQDLTVQSVIEPKGEKGVDLILKVKDRSPVHVALEYDNYGNRLVGRQRVGLGVSAGNALTTGDTLVARVTRPFEADDAKPYIQAGYSFPVGKKGTRLELNYANTQTLAGEELRVLDIRGDLNLWAFRVLVPGTLTLEKSSYWTGELFSKTVKNTYYGGLPLTHDEIRALAFAHRGTKWRSREGSQVSYGAGLTVGLGDWLGGTPSGSTNSSRIGADNAFGKLNGDLAYIKKWGERSFFVARATGQYAGDGLLVSEQFSLGGPDSVRGYNPGEFLGDNAIQFTAEYRRSLLEGSSNNLQLVVFADHGKAWLKDALTGEVPSLSLTGAGVGVRGTLGRHVTYRTDVGVPLSPNRNLQGDSVTVHSQVTSRW